MITMMTTTESVGERYVHGTATAVCVEYEAVVSRPSGRVSQS